MYTIHAPSYCHDFLLVNKPDPFCFPWMDMTRIVRAGSLGPGPGRLALQRPLLLLLASLSQERKHVCLPRNVVNAGDAPRHAVVCGPLGQFTSIFARNQKQRQQQKSSQVNRSENSGCMLQSKYVTVKIWMPFCTE